MVYVSAALDLEFKEKVMSDFERGFLILIIVTTILNWIIQCENRSFSYKLFTFAAILSLIKIAFILVSEIMK